MGDLWKTAVRELTLLALFFLPRDKKISIERWLRGREEFRKLTHADCVIVSYGKSGRTWLRVMLSRFYQIKYGLSERHLLSFDNLHNKICDIPKIFFTHDNYIKDYTGEYDNKSAFYNKKVIILSRNPQDVAVSQYFQWRYRMRARKKNLNDYPTHGEQISVYDFVIRPQSGLPKIIEFLNDWAREMPRIEQLLLVRYEDMRTRPEETMKRILNFVETPGSDAEVKEAVAFASYENMRKLEERKVFWLSGRRLVPRDRGNPHSYKVRRGKVGGYRDYFSDQETAELEKLVCSRLSPAYGYGQGDGHGVAAVAPSRLRRE